MADNGNYDRRPRTPKGREEPDQTPQKPSGNGPTPGGPNTPPGRNGVSPPRALFFMLVLVVVGFFVVIGISGSGGAAKEVTFAEFKNLANSGQLKEDVVFRENGLYAIKIDPKDSTEKGQVYVELFGDAVVNRVLGEVQDQTKLKPRFERLGLGSQLLQSLIYLIPFLLILLIGWFILFRGLRSAGGGPGGVLGNFGKSRHKMLMKEKTGVTFDDVAGIDEAKDEVEEIIQFLKAPKRFMKLGGRVPRGVLLIGEPGCGKTLLAKAIAGEADVPFFSISGSDFVEMFVGVGASRVRDLFKQAKESAPCIIFLDEIDAVGRRRGGGFTTGGHDEREQTLNAILVEMDGFATGDGVIVIAATNRADVLDPALTRPGRFDRQITVPLPDVKGRLEIIRVHAKNKKLGPDVNLERLAKITPMFSGADLFALMNEAAIGATLQNKDFIEQEDFEEARDKIRYGRARKSRQREADENKLTAYHEAGHAVLQVMLKDADPLHKVTILPRGSAGGATFSLPDKDRYGFGLKWLKATMRVACGGRIAEARAMNDASSGAVADISTITRIAHTMIEEWGMSEKLGFVRYTGSDTRESYMPERQYSEATAKLIDEEVKRIVDEAYADADRMLTENWEKVEAVAQALLKYETLDVAEVLKIMRGEPIGKPTVSDLLAEEARRSAAAALPAAGDPAKPDLGTGAMPNPA
ncbi:MAG: ATP-dependent zinc metalloprotease FtsH [Phycisphaerales bacterium]|nr:ATP-dependent zinc metalloprotease FtsH [Phycisphaerales bacterium]